MHGTNRNVGNALPQLPADRRRIDQKPSRAYPGSPQVHTGSANGRFGQWYAATGRFERDASQRNPGFETGI